MTPGVLPRAYAFHEDAPAMLRRFAKALTSSGVVAKPRHGKAPAATLASVSGDDGEQLRWMLAHG